MPAYEFLCNSCGRFEIYQGMNDRHEALCPNCSKKAMRLFSVPQITGDLPTILKGKANESKVIMACESMGGQ